MNHFVLEKFFEHNDWANRRLIERVTELSDEQLESKPQPGSEWSIRFTLTHLVEAQANYVGILTSPPESREPASVSWSELTASADRSGAKLLEIARAETGASEPARSSDGYVFDRWVVLVQAVNHANDHRRQLCKMLEAIGVTPPRLDGWGFGEASGVLRKE